MGIMKLESESVIASIVEGMLPRFSDEKLGLMIGVDMHIWDGGYGKDGNTRERREKNVRKYLYFLFVRPSNYTKVLFWEPKKDAKGLDCSPHWSKGITEWHLESDHDSCWRDAVGSKLTEEVFAARDKFKGRKKTGVDLSWNDLSEYIHFMHGPSYVKLNTFEQKDPKADRFSDEGRIWNVQMESVDFSDLATVKSPDTRQIGQAGLLLKNGERFLQYADTTERVRQMLAKKEGVTANDTEKQTQNT